MAGTDDIADAGMQAFDEEHRQVQSPGERPDWEGVEEAQAGAHGAEARATPASSRARARRADATTRSTAARRAERPAGRRQR